MHLKSLSLVNFKNYGQAELQFSGKINCFVGENGVGKTNLLDAIHYLSLCKSNFNPVDIQNVKYEEDFCVIQGVFERLGKQENIYCGIRRQKKKQFKRNQKEYQKLSEHIGLIPLVMISPADSILVNGGSEERRKFMNGVIAQYNRRYLDDLILYNRAVTQRNSLLKEMSRGTGSPTGVLEVWDEQLIRYGVPVYLERKRFVQELLPVFARFYEQVSGGREEVTLTYQTQLDDTDFREGLERSREKDRIVQYTTFGVHKDDLEMLVGTHPLKKSGSQGQQKTYLVALKLAEFEFIRQIKELPPILLLDDVFDKFDSRRVAHIIGLVAENNFGQIFITDTSEERMEKILSEIPADHRLFRIGQSGQLEQV